MQHYMREISKYVRTNKETRDQLTDTIWIKLLSGSADDFVDSTCCAKVPHPELYCGIGSSHRIPSFTPWKCVHGTCDNCGLEQTHKLEECELLTKCAHEIDLLE